MKARGANRWRLPGVEVRRALISAANRASSGGQRIRGAFNHFNVHEDAVPQPSALEHKPMTQPATCIPNSQMLPQSQHGTSYNREDAELLDQRFEEVVFKQQRASL